MVTFQNLSVAEETRRRAALAKRNRAFKKARLSEDWYIKVRYAIRTGDKHATRKLEIYKRVFPECLNFIRALEGMARDFAEGN